MAASLLSYYITQVTSLQYESCDLTTLPLHEWGQPSVDNSVIISDLSPGVYYYYCSVAGHCDAGMKLQVTIVPYTPYRVIQQPVKGVCQSDRCSFSYQSDHTPYLISVEVTSCMLSVLVGGRGWAMLCHVGLELDLERMYKI